MMAVERLKGFKAEGVFIFLALILALGLRFYDLGSAPMSDTEAEWALQALRVSQSTNQGELTVLEPQPAYIFLTGILFAFFGSTNFLARFWPALAGGLLVLAPYIFRKTSPVRNTFSENVVGIAAVVLSFAFAIDPALVTVSRQAGGPMMGLSFSILAIGLWLLKKPVLAGIFAGVAVLGGPSVLLGLLSMAAAYLITRLVSLRSRSDVEETTEFQSTRRSTVSEKPSTTDQPSGLKPFLISVASAVIVVGTMLMLYPQGIGAWFNTIPEFLSGWFTEAMVPASRIAGALLVYELFAVLFSLVLFINLIRSREQRTFRVMSAFAFLVIWFALGFLLLLLYPARSASDLVWIIIPLWTLGAFGITQLIPKQRIKPFAIAQAAFLLVLAGLFWYTIAATTRAPYGVSQHFSQFAIMVGILALGGLTSTLVALGYGWKVSGQGLFLGVTASLLLYSISVMWGASIIRQNHASELFSSTPSPDQTTLFTKVVCEFSTWNTGFPNEIDITSMVETPSIQWIMRDFPNGRFSVQLDKDALPSIVITREGLELPSLNADYRGEDFVWWASPGWQGAFPPDIARWLTFREAPIANQKIIVWFRSDLFKNGDSNLIDTSSDF